MRRFVQAFSGEDLGQPPEAGAHDRYNIGKGDLAWVITAEDGEASWREMRWGLVPALSKLPETAYSTITARLSRAPKSRIFGGPWRHRRCLVPITGYYKWNRTVKPAQPHFIQAADGEVLHAAGLWECWEREDPGLLSFAVLTHENAAIPAPLTPDGPIFVPARARASWLSGSMCFPQARLAEIRQPALVSCAVGPGHRDRARDGYTLIEPLSALTLDDAGMEAGEDMDDDES